MTEDAQSAAELESGGMQRGGMTAGNGKTSYTSAQATAALTRTGLHWSTAGGTATVTYAFRATGSPPDNYTTFSQFNSTQIAITQQMLAAWSDVANINFVRVGSGTSGASAYSDSATILFGNYNGGPSDAAAFAYMPGPTQAGSIAGDVWVDGRDSYNVSPALGSYGALTLLHEIGHTIGLSHPGDYDATDNGDAITYANSAAYYEDSYQYTVMSYFDESNTGGNFGYQYSYSPMLDDIAAIQSIYGARAERTGDTVYGFNSNAGQPWYVATATSVPIFAAWDTGGNDTFDFSGYSQAQTIDLRAGQFSNVGGLTHNVTIAYGVTIENAIGGSGNDILYGNDVANTLNGGAGDDMLDAGAGNDVLIGGPGHDAMYGREGNDTFQGTLADMSGDWVDDFDVGDRIVITDGDAATATVTRSGSDFVVNGTIIHVDQDYSFSGRLLVDAAGSGLEIVAVNVPVASDFNGDRHSDILWLNSGGAISTWSDTASGARDAFAQNSYFAAVASSWHAVETFDMGGDGLTDILWRNDNGAVSVWSGQAGGNFQQSSFNAAAPTSWHIVAAGDVTGDGKGDIVWQNADGAISLWASTGAGFTQNSYYHGAVASGWSIAGLGDFNADGHADLLWRNTDGGVAVWNGTASGFSEGSYYAKFATSWQIAAVADFTGDGRDDILWRNANGALTMWSSDGFGGFNNTSDPYAGASVNAQAPVNVDTSWHIEQTGDFNGDGKADILWRNDNGAISIWHSNGTGFDQNTYYDSSVGAVWQVQGHDFS